MKTAKPMICGCGVLQTEENSYKYPNGKLMTQCMECRKALRREKHKASLGFKKPKRINGWQIL